MGTLPHDCPLAAHHPTPGKPPGCSSCAFLAHTGQESPEAKNVLPAFQQEGSEEGCGQSWNITSTSVLLPAAGQGTILSTEGDTSALGSGGEIESASRTFACSDLCSVRLEGLFPGQREVLTNLIKIASTQDHFLTRPLNVFERERPCHAGVTLCSYVLRVTWVIFLGGLTGFCEKLLDRMGTSLLRDTRNTHFPGKLFGKSVFSSCSLFCLQNVRDRAIFHFQLIISSSALWGFNIMSQKLMTDPTLLFYYAS